MGVKTLDEDGADGGDGGGDETGKRVTGQLISGKRRSISAGRFFEKRLKKCKFTAETAIHKHS